MADPGIHVGGQQRRQDDGQGQRFRQGILFTDQLIECQLLHPQVVLGRNLLRDDQIEPRLRLPRIGDGAGANLKIALGKSELLCDRDFLRADKGECVLRGQDVEVGRADTHHQVLFRRLQQGLRCHQGLLALFEDQPVGRAV